MKQIFKFIMLVASLMFFASCSNGDYSDSPILGTWYCIDDDGTKITLQFGNGGDGAYCYTMVNGDSYSGSLHWSKNSYNAGWNVYRHDIFITGDYFLVGDNLVCGARSYSRAKPNDWDSSNTGGENPYLTIILGKWTGMIDDDELEYTMEFKANGIMEESYTYDGEYSWDSFSYTISGSTLILDESSIMNNIYGTNYIIMSLTSSKLILKTDFNDILTFSKR